MIGSLPDSDLLTAIAIMQKRNVDRYCFRCLVCFDSMDKSACRRHSAETGCWRYVEGLRGLQVVQRDRGLKQICSTGMMSTGRMTINGG